MHAVGYGGCNTRTLGPPDSKSTHLCCTILSVQESAGFHCQMCFQKLYIQTPLTSKNSISASMFPYSQLKVYHRSLLIPRGTVAWEFILHETDLQVKSEAECQRVTPAYICSWDAGWRDCETIFPSSIQTTCMEIGLNLFIVSAEHNSFLISEDTTKKTVYFGLHGTQIWNCLDDPLSL